MNARHLSSIALAAMLPLSACIQTASAELPMMEQPWLGNFAVAEAGKFHFTIAANGETKITLIGKDRQPLLFESIVLRFGAYEPMPDGSRKDLTMLPDTLESKDPATAKLQKTVFRCKLADPAKGPTMEIAFEIARGTVLAHARIIDKGAFDKNPVRPVIKTFFPQCYKNELERLPDMEKGDAKAFEKRIAKDTITLKHLDGKRIKLKCEEKFDPKSKEANGISSAEVEIDHYQSKKFELLAAPNSSLVLGNAGQTASLYDGFWFEWSADAVKDLDGKAKLAIMIK
jgi:hypothetical protein